MTAHSKYLVESVNRVAKLIDFEKKVLIVAPCVFFCHYVSFIALEYKIRLVQKSCFGSLSLLPACFRYAKLKFKTI